MKRRHYLETGLVYSALALVSLAMWLWGAHDPFKLFMCAAWAALGLRRLWLYHSQKPAPEKPE